MDETPIMTTPGQSAASSNNARLWPQFLAGLRKYVESNLAASVVTAWSVFLFAGGIVFLGYFASIGFMLG